MSDVVVARLRAAGCVFAEEEAALLVDAAPDAATLASLTARRVAGEPLEQVLGWTAFAGLRIAVEPGVFVPRRRSELVVREALRVLADLGPEGSRPDASGPDALCPDGPRLATRRVVVDLCCGSGALGAAVAAGAPRERPVEVHGADVEPAAVRCARRNLSPRDGHHVHLGDLWDAVPGHLRGRVDVVVANAPYVPTEAIPLMPPEARDHEPASSLDGGPDGTTVQARVAARAAEWLRPGGHLLVETSRRQAPTTLALLEASGLAARLVTDDELDGTVAVGRREPGRAEPIR